MSADIDVIGYELIKDLAVLAQGRTPILKPAGWTFSGGSGKPSSLAAGIDCEGKLMALVGVRLRTTEGKRKAWLRVDTGDAGETYGFESDGWDVTVAGVAGDPDATITALKGALEAEADFATAKNGTATISAFKSNILELEADEPVTYEIGSGVSGSPYQSGIAEATGVLWRVWGLPLGVDQWALLQDQGPWFTTDAFALVPIRCAGHRRLFVEILTSDGAVLAFVGAAVRDDLSDTPLEDAAALLTTADDTTRYSFAADEAGQVTHSFTGERDGGIKTQGVVSVATSSTLILPARPGRKSYRVRNLEASGGGEVYLAWLTASKTAAAITDLRLAGAEVDYRGGEGVPPNGLLAIADGSGPYNVWVEET